MLKNPSIFSMLGEGLYTHSCSNSGNKIVCSRLRQYEGIQKKSAHVSLKYVFRGKENYTLNGRTHTVRDGEFLLVNDKQYYETSLNSKEDVLGLCIFLNRATLSDVYQNASKPEIFLLDDPHPTFSTFEFHENVYRAETCEIGRLISTLCTRFELDQKKLAPPEDDLYYALALKLLESQWSIAEQIRKIPASKLSTKQELYRRVSYARRMMDECPQQNFDVASLAREASLSEFHFFRTFKQIEGISPHQYLMKRKIATAIRYLEKGNESITAIASALGFSDVHAFSKTFKKFMHVAPSEYLEKSAR